MLQESSCTSTHILISREVPIEEKRRNLRWLRAVCNLAPNPLPPGSPQVGQVSPEVGPEEALISLWHLHLTCCALFLTPEFFFVFYQHESLINVFSKLQNVFVQINRYMYVCKLQNVFVQSTKCVCPNYKQKINTNILIQSLPD